MTQTTLPANIDPRIAAILRQRAEQAIIISKTAPRPVPTTAPQVPAAPQPAAPAPRPVPQPQVRGLDATPMTETPVSDAELAELLARILPQIDALVRQAIGNIRSDGKLTMAEALALAPEIRNIVSAVVAQGLPQIKDRSAYDLVVLVLAQLIGQYVAPSLPAVVRPYLTAATLKAVVRGLQFAYDTWVRPRLGK